MNATDCRCGHDHGSTPCPEWGTPNDQCTHPNVTHHHGTRVCYIRDRCRCHACTAATTQYERERQHHKAITTWHPHLATMVDAEPARQHLRWLSTQGMGWKRAARAAGLSTGTVHAILYGKYPHNPEHPDYRPPRKQLHRHTADAILNVQPTPNANTVIDATGTIRRLRALVAAGWPQTELARRIGYDSGNFWALIQHRQRVTHHTATTISNLYDQLWQGPARHDSPHRRGASTRATLYAAARGWAPPLAWDDDTTGPHGIDNPDATPHTDTTPAPNARTARTRLDPDEIEWLLDGGCTPHDIATRYGRQPDSIEKALHSAGRPDLARRMRGTDRLGHIHTGTTRRRGAA